MFCLFGCLLGLFVCGFVFVCFVWLFDWLVGWFCFAECTGSASYRAFNSSFTRNQHHKVCAKSVPYLHSRDNVAEAITIHG